MPEPVGDETFRLTQEELLELIARVREADFSLFQLRSGDLEVVIRQGDDAESGFHERPAGPAPAGEAHGEPPSPGAMLVVSPLVGIFYRRPSPLEPPYVEVGSRVLATTTIGLVEAMKVFTSVSAGVDGTVAALVAEDHATVEQGQALVWIAPSAARSSGGSEAVANELHEGQL